MPRTPVYRSAHPTQRIGMVSMAEGLTAQMTAPSKNGAGGTEERVHALETGQAVQAATVAGMQATQAAVTAGAEATQAALQAGNAATTTAMQAGTMATMMSGAAGFVAGIFLGLAVAGGRRG